MYIFLFQKSVFLDKTQRGFVQRLCVPDPQTLGFGYTLPQRDHINVVYAVWQFQMCKKLCHNELNTDNISKLEFEPQTRQNPKRTKIMNC